MYRAAYALLVGLMASALGPLAAADWEMDSELSGDLGTLDLYALVTYEWETATYAYFYELTATDIASPAHYIDLGNPHALYFWDAFNSDGFTDPIYEEFLTSMVWADGLLAPGEAVLFGFKSEYPPGEVPISVFNTGQRASGVTLGMVPEPCLGFVVLTALGAMGLRRRGR